MNRHLPFTLKQLASAVALGAAALAAAPALSGVTDISNAPLASASNQSVLPNVMFILDDSGSMDYDTLPDNTENSQMGSERRYFDELYQCKPKGILTTGNYKAGLMPTICDRVDPPFGAAQFNGLYYDPTVRYRPAVNYLGSPIATISYTNASCDPFPTARNCRDFYPIGDYDNNGAFQRYYDGQALNAYLPKGQGNTPTNTGQTYQNAAMANWYGTGSSVNLSSAFPEAVYCNNVNATVSTIDANGTTRDTNGYACRRNGTPVNNSGTAGAAETGNTFRYTTARWRSGYPEAKAVHQFVRPSSGSTVTVTTAAPHGLRSISATGNYPIFNTYFVVPRTNTGTTGAGFDSCSGATCNTPITVTVGAANTFTYSKNTGFTVAYAGLDFQWQFTRLKSTTDNNVYVTAPNHGLIVGDKINVYATAGNDTFGTSGANQLRQHINCGQGGTQTVATVLDADHFYYTVPTSGTVPNTATTCAAYNGTATVTVPGFVQKTGLFNIPKLKLGNAFYYTIQPTEYCSDTALTTCKAATAPDTANGYIYPAPLRYCANIFDANRLDTPTGLDTDANTNQPRCREKFQEISDAYAPAATFTGCSVSGGCPYATNPAGLQGKRLGYIYPRYGQFVRVDVASGATFPKAVARTDCAAATSCTLAEEQQNFANWFAFYRTRMQMMKTTAGLTFQPMDTRFRIGWITINPGSPVDVYAADGKSHTYLPIATFDSTQKQKWYDVFYTTSPGGGTPLPQALSRVGRYFAGITNTGINKGITDDPVQYSCQQNFAILTTDGYWNLPASGVDLKGNALGDVDNKTVDARGNAIVRPMYDGNLNVNTATSTTVGTVSDVALYYYLTDLRDSSLGNGTGALGTDVTQDNVPTNDTDTANWQHMVTFGLGMSTGLMHYQPDYAAKNSTGDFNNVRKGALSGCSWTTGQCNWPVPGFFQPANLDDLWHAAVNGRGDFFFASDTASVQAGLTQALTNMQARNAAGAAAATSTPNITPTDRGEFLTTYISVDWTGEVAEKLIDPNTGAVSPTAVWTARDQLESMTSATSDSRRIILRDVNLTGGATKNFLYGTLTAAEKTWFDNVCSGSPIGPVSQCSTLDFGTGTASAPSVNSDMWQANQGANMVNFLRGQTQLRGTIYRNRPYALGDTVNATPVFIGKPRNAFADLVTPSYSDWKALPAIAGRTPMVYVGANDGMLHAFNATTGAEMWAYIPRMVAPNMWKLTDTNYGGKHAYYVDGSPSTMDVWDGSTWRTLLVGALNSGGRGYYALDVTDPGAPLALWEFCSDTTLTLCSVADANLGFSYGNPVITKRAYDGRWVVLVTSGYNNVSPGDGHGHLYVLDALSGAILDNVKTPDAGNNTTPIPSGLSRIAVWAANPAVDNTGLTLYGGDLLGNIWKFDLAQSPPTVLLLGQAKDTGGKPQPITTKPELALVNSIYRVVYVGTGRYVGNADLTDPATQTSPVPNPVTAWMQSLYAFKDTGTSLGVLRSAGGMVKQTLTSLSATQRTVSSNAVDFSTQTGWYVDFNLADSPGERVNLDPQLALGTLIVTTNVPNTTACSVGGDAWVYQFNYLSGTFVANTPGGVVANKQTGALAVGMVVYQLQKGSLVGQLQRSDTQQVQQGIYTGPGSQPHRRTSWRELTH